MNIMLEDEYEINYFTENNFIKKKCIKCNNIFWTQDSNRLTCGDTPCDIYEFIGDPIFGNTYTIDSMRKYYINFFKERNHTPIDRYPVVARWRNDIYLTIASIANFQPFITSGLANPPANPLVISQPCIRLNDIDSVGRTGRHLTTFEMMAHHVFNNSNKEYYWKDQTIKLCNDFLLSLGTKKENITYIENPWSGGGNAGASVEVMVNGLELATLVFMNLKENNNGNIIIKNKKYEKMENYIVDTGYGLERFVWASNGSATIYDALFPDILDELSLISDVNRDINDEKYNEIFSKSAKLAGMMDVNTTSTIQNLRKSVAKEINIDVDKLNKFMDPIEKLYAIVDHTRCLSYMLTDGIIPSNVKSGYLARLVIRKTLKLMKDINLEKKISLSDIIKLHLESILEYKGMNKQINIIEEILSIEEQKYNLTLDNGKKVVKKEIAKYKSMNFPIEKVIELYDSHGIPPEITKEIGSKLNVNISYPDNFYSLIADKHNESNVKEIENKVFINTIQHLPTTRKMYYDEPERFEFEAVVLEVFDNYIILDSTLFYPEGGGQEADHGTITSGLFNYNVVNVIIQNDIILHKVEIAENGLLINKGDIIVGQIDKNRRMIFTKHHTATHIINDAAKKVLGSHIWQAGSQITTQGARLDITHYKKITTDELKNIEYIANKTVMENKKIQFEVLERTEAEQKYGFRLYQGGVPSGKYLRIVKIGTDIEACAGTHCLVTGTIGIIKIIKIDRIQDNIERIEFKVGEVAIEYIQQESDLISESCNVLSISKEMLLKAINKFFIEWKQQKKSIEKLTLSLAKYRAEDIINNGININNITINSYFCKDLSLDELKSIAFLIMKKRNIICLLGTFKNNLLQILIVNSIDSKSYKNEIKLKEIIDKILIGITYSDGGNNNIWIVSCKNELRSNLEYEKLCLIIKNKYYELMNNKLKNIN